MKSLAMYGATLRRAARGKGAPLTLLDDTGAPRWIADALTWSGAVDHSDRSVLRRCAGPTLDIGCGPGRLTAALHRAGVPALGVDISAEAVRQTRQRGAAAMHCSVFQPLPDEGGWQHVLLIDGNIGIGGDPIRLLHRANRLVSRCGSVLVELAAPGVGAWSAPVRLTDGVRRSEHFHWAVVGVDDLADLAEAAALRIADLWQETGRWFAELSAC